MKTSNLTLTELIEQVKALTLQPVAYIDEVPEILKEDFHTFIIGRSLSSMPDGRSITYDMPVYLEKLLRKGIDYPVQWKTK